jgi:uncharacterized protein YjbJ (UPF0337 family)
MSSYPTDEPVYPATPIYDEAVVTTTASVPGEGSDSSKASQAAGQAKETAGQAKETVKQTAGEVKDQAAGVASTAKGAGQQVASTTRDEAQRVVGDVLSQARNLFRQATHQLSSQASTQQDRLTQGIRTFGQDLTKMGSGEQVGSGPALNLIQNVAGRAERVADWFESRRPEEVLTEVRQYAARRPGLFIALAATGGAVAARVTKALVADAKPSRSGGAGSGYENSGYEGADSTYVTGARETYVAPEPVVGTGYGAQGEQYGAGAEYGADGEYGTGTGFGGTGGVR